jgi:nucleoid DNA-binding protein
VNCVADSMVKALEQGEGIEIRGFGLHGAQYKATRRNPRTGETVHVAPGCRSSRSADLRERVSSLAGTPPIDDDRDDDDEPGQVRRRD